MLHHHTKIKKDINKKDLLDTHQEIEVRKKLLDLLLNAEYHIMHSEHTDALAYIQRAQTLAKKAYME